MITIRSTNHATKFLPLLAAFLLMLLPAAHAGAADELPPKIKIVLVGDSTVTDQAGWGKAFAALLGPQAECVNLARSGQSSKSFYDAGNWKKALAEHPTYVLIQFGHNDQPGKGPQRETDPATTYRDYLNRYISEARAAQAKPILVTSLARRIFTPEGKIRTDQVPYVEAVRAVAKETEVPLIDLYALSVELAERLGPEASKPFGPPHPKLAEQFDGTHLSSTGAARIAPLIAQRLIAVEPALQPYLLPQK